jgi:hypothetical protein
MGTHILDVRENYGGVSLASGVETTILGPMNLLRYGLKAFSVYNLGPGTVSGLYVQTNPDYQGYDTTRGATLANGATGQAPNAGLWEDYDTTSLQNLAAGSVVTVDIANVSRRWWRLRGLNDAKDGVALTVSGYLYAQTG